MRSAVSAKPDPACSGIYRVAAFAPEFPGLRHGFVAAAVMANGGRPATDGVLRDIFGTTAGATLELDQPHGVALLDARHPHPGLHREGRAGRGYDGAIGAAGSAMVIAIRSADCVPILAVDAELGEFAALHAGWRGAAAGILPGLLAEFRARGSSLAGVGLAFGPCIRACCFEVQQDCIARFQPEHLRHALVHRAGGAYLDLIAVLSNQARAAGLEPRQVLDLGLCTACHTDADGRHPFASYRRSRRLGSELRERNVAFIGVSAANEGMPGAGRR